MIWRTVAQLSLAAYVVHLTFGSSPGCRSFIAARWRLPQGPRFAGESL